LAIEKASRGALLDVYDKPEGGLLLVSVREKLHEILKESAKVPKEHRRESNLVSEDPC